MIPHAAFDPTSTSKPLIKVRKKTNKKEGVVSSPSSPMTPADTPGYTRNMSDWSINTTSSHWPGASSRHQAPDSTPTSKISRKMTPRGPTEVENTTFHLHAMLRELENYAESPRAAASRFAVRRNVGDFSQVSMTSANSSQSSRPAATGRVGHGFGGERDSGDGSGIGSELDVTSSFGDLGDFRELRGLTKQGEVSHTFEPRFQGDNNFGTTFRVEAGPLKSNFGHKLKSKLSRTFTSPLFPSVEEINSGGWSAPSTPIRAARKPSPATISSLLSEDSVSSVVPSPLRIQKAKGNIISSPSTAARSQPPALSSPVDIYQPLQPARSETSTGHFDWEDAINAGRQRLVQAQVDITTAALDIEGEAQRDPHKEAKDFKARLIKEGARLIERSSDHGWAPKKPLSIMTDDQIAAVGLAIMNYELHGIWRIFKHADKKEAKAEILKYQYQLRQQEIRRMVESAKAKGMSTPRAANIAAEEAVIQFDEGIYALYGDHDEDGEEDNQDGNRENDREDDREGDDHEYKSGPSKKAYIAHGSASLSEGATAIFDRNEDGPIFEDPNDNDSPVGLGISRPEEGYDADTENVNDMIDRMIDRQSGATSRLSFHHNDEDQVSTAYDDEACSEHSHHREYRAAQDGFAPEVLHVMRDSSFMANDPTDDRVHPKRNSSFLRNLRNLASQRMLKSKTSHPALRGGGDGDEEIVTCMVCHKSICLECADVCREEGKDWVVCCECNGDDSAACREASMA